MPKVTIWIREEDYKKWQAIKGKPAFIHSAINNVIMSKMKYDKLINQQKLGSKLYQYGVDEKQTLQQKLYPELQRTPPEETA